MAATVNRLRGIGCILLAGLALACVAGCCRSDGARLRSRNVVLEVRTTDPRGKPLGHVKLQSIYPVSTGLIEAESNEDGLAIMNLGPPLASTVTVFSYEECASDASLSLLLGDKDRYQVEIRKGYSARYDEEGLLVEMKRLWVP